MYVGSGQSVRVDADQSFQVEFYMTEDKYKNEAIRASIAQSTPQIISDVMAVIGSDVTAVVGTNVTAAINSDGGVTIKSDAMGSTGLVTDSKTAKDP